MELYIAISNVERAWKDGSFDISSNRLKAQEAHDLKINNIDQHGQPGLSVQKTRALRKYFFSIDLVLPFIMKVKLCRLKRLGQSS